MRLEIDPPLVRRLVAAQFPEWGGLPVVPVARGGWSNRSFRLGDDMVARLPRAKSYAAQVEKERRWLPILAPHLPLPIPTPIAAGAPGDDYPWRWSIYRWLEGDTALDAPAADQSRLASDLGAFLIALRAVDTRDAPPPGAHNFHRGGRLATYDAQTCLALRTLGDRIDARVVAAIWDDALVSEWTRPPVWLHGDVAPANLLVRDGRLSAVIDFGECAVGDPACDLAIAWTTFDAPARARFRDAVAALDAATWSRGRGWALWKALITLAALPGTDPTQVEAARRTLDALLDEAR